MLGHALRRRKRHHRRYLRRLLGSGGTAAPERESLALLPSGPDAVRTLPVRGTRSSTPRAQTLSRRTVPRTAFGPAWSGFRVQGTADSPPSAAERGEGTTSPRDYHRQRLVIEATLYTDAGCPWAYSANPALRVLEWRFRDQLRWRLVMIGLREEASEAAVRAYDPDRALTRWRVYEERYGMPFATEAKARPSGTGRGCRAVVAAGMLDPGSEWTVFRALQIANFTSPTLFLDDDGEHPRGASRRCPASTRTASQSASTTPTSSPSTSTSKPRRARRRALRRRRRTRPRHRTGRCGSPRRPSCSVAETDSAFAGGWQPLLSYDTRAGELRSRARTRSAAGVAGAAPRALPGRVDDRRDRAAARRRLRSDSRTDDEAERMLLELAASGRVARAVAGR